jgi:hypothetical protein
MEIQPSDKSDATVRLGACQCHSKNGNSRILRFVMKENTPTPETPQNEFLLTEQARIRNGGVDEPLKPAVWKNKIAVLLSGRKFN